MLDQLLNSWDLMSHSRLLSKPDVFWQAGLNQACLVNEPSSLCHSAATLLDCAQCGERERGGMGTREEPGNKTKIRKKNHNIDCTPHNPVHPVYTDTDMSVSICSHVLFFNYSSHKPPDINIFKNINMTIHKCAHSSRVSTWHQKWKRRRHTCWLLHIDLDTKWTQYGQNLTNNGGVAQKE